jgi:hypothetical protein
MLHGRRPVRTRRPCDLDLACRTGTRLVRSCGDGRVGMLGNRGPCGRLRIRARVLSRFEEGRRVSRCRSRPHARTPSESGAARGVVADRLPDAGRRRQRCRPRYTCRHLPTPRVTHGHAPGLRAPSRDGIGPSCARCCSGTGRSIRAPTRSLSSTARAHASMADVDDGLARSRAQRTPVGRPARRFGSSAFCGLTPGTRGPDSPIGSRHRSPGRTGPPLRAAGPT